MAVFVARKCACGGKLEFDPTKKIWICKYCGTVVEREATFDKVKVDGIEGVSDVVRQTLKDVANQKMESAGKNLEDCERKGHSHVGTLLANLSFNLANISCAKTQDEAKGSIDKVKILGARLNQEFPTIAEDEINLYESFGDDADDIFANLLVVFDTLGDSGRVEYVSSKLRPDRVYSPHANRTLLKVAIRRNEYDVVDSIIKNIGHIDRKTSLQEVMEHYPCNEKKIDLIKSLFNAEVATSLTKRFFENYFATIKDSVDVKAEVVRLLNTTDIHVNAEIIVKNSQEQLEQYSDVKKIFDAIYEKKISDQETEALLVFCLIVNKNFDVQNAFFDSLIENNAFVALNARTVISFLDSSGFSGDEKSEVLRKMLGFSIDSKALDAIYNYYLNNNGDDANTREAVIGVLLQDGSPISTSTVKNYVVNTKTDENKKPAVIEKIFETGINKTYVGDLLSEYMIHSTDTEEVKRIITDYLIKQGFKADSNVLSEYVTDSEDDIKTKIEKTKQLIQNGTQIKADSIDNYIMSIKQPKDFSEEMFNLLTSHSYSVSTEGYLKYLLFCKDIDKIRHNEKLVHAVSGDLNGRIANVNHNGNSVNCNAFQAYVLNTTDSFDMAEAIANEFNRLHVKLNSEIVVNGATVKFKKYVGDNKDVLSPLSMQLCEENKMFSLF